MLGLNGAVFYDKNKEKSLKLGLSNLKLEQIWKNQARAQRQRIR